MTAFSDFWAAYPKKRAKLDAEKAWKQALRRGVTPEQIMACLALMKRTEWRRRKPDFYPYPATFLRGEAFDDRCETLVDEAPEVDLAAYAFHCVDCEEPHEWTADVRTWTTLPDVRTCPCVKAIERMKVHA